MRITIEIDEKQPTPTVKAGVEHTSAPIALEAPALSGGGAPAELLQTLGVVSEDVQSRSLNSSRTIEASADAILAGTPPEWLVRAIESATPFRPGKY